MQDVIVTGASRGIGRALALALAGGDRRLLVASRDGSALDTLVGEIDARKGSAVAVPGDIGSVNGATELGERIGTIARPGAIVVHNAGVWPSRKVVDERGLEEAWRVNVLGPIALQRALDDTGVVSRVVVVGAGLMVKGRFDPQRTPRGDDFSAFRTYATTKLCAALVFSALAERRPDLDVLVVHPGVVRTDLGARTGLLGALLSWVKKRWESPEACAERLAQIVARDRWSSPGEARWMFESTVADWPAPADDPALRASVVATVLASLKWTELPPSKPSSARPMHEVV